MLDQVLTLLNPECYQVHFLFFTFTKEVIQKKYYNIFYVKIKPEFPQYSPFYLEILLKERKNRNKIIFYYTYGLSWEKKQKKWVNVKKWPIYNI